MVVASGCASEIVQNSIGRLVGKLNYCSLEHQGKGNEREGRREGQGNNIYFGKREYPGESGEIKKKARILDYLVREGKDLR